MNPVVLLGRFEFNPAISSVLPSANRSLMLEQSDAPMRRV